MGLFKFLSKRESLTKTSSKVNLSTSEDQELIIGEYAEILSFKLLAFQIAVSYIANIISKCEIKVFVDGKEEKNELYYLLNYSPNINESASKLKIKLINKLFYDGKALMFQKDDSFYIADNFGIEERAFKPDIYTNISLKNEMLKNNILASDSFLFELDNIRIKSLIDSMYEDLGQVLSYAIESFKSSNAEKYKLILDQTKAGDPEFTKTYENVIKKQLKEFLNSDKAVYPQYKNYNLEKFTIPTGKTDSTDIRNLRKEIFETIASAFKIPINLIYGNMTNVKDVVNQLVTFVIDPVARMMSEELTRKTTYMEDYLSGCEVKVDTTSVYHMDLFDIADKADKFISSGIYCVDEIREKLGENLLNTDFSKKHWITKNFSTAEEAVKGEIEEGGG